MLSKEDLIHKIFNLMYLLDGVGVVSDKVIARLETMQTWELSNMSWGDEDDLRAFINESDKQ